MSEGDRSVLCAIIVILLFSLVPAARGQDHSPEHAQSHALSHDEYRNWASERTDYCCNNEDCRALADNEWRETTKGTEVLIRGTWCPVQKQHFILKGKSPDWNVAHACILGNSHYPANQCDRLLCFAGRAQW
jgi:hypothetical protein